MAFPFLVSFLLGVSLTTLLLAFGARRLLGAQFPLFRTLIAGVAAQTAVNSITNGLVRSIHPRSHTASGTVVLAVILSWACGFVIAMALLVLAAGGHPEAVMGGLSFGGGWPGLPGAGGQQTGGGWPSRLVVGGQDSGGWWPTKMVALTWADASALSTVTGLSAAALKY